MIHSWCRRLFLACALAAPGLLGASIASAEPPEFSASSDDQPCSPGWLEELRLDAGPETQFQTGFVSRAESSDSNDASLLPAALHDAGESEIRVLESEGEVSGLSANTLPNDWIFQNGGQRNVRRINVPEAWEVTFGRKEVTIAVIADGVEYTHEDLKNKIWRNVDEVPGNGLDDDGNGYVDDLVGWDFGTTSLLSDDDNEPMPIMHPAPDRIPVPQGTAMAGIAAAEANNAIGIAGIGWHSRIMPLKVSGPRVRDGKVEGVSGSLVNVTRAICYAANNGADVIVTLSAGIPLPDLAVDELMDMQQAIQYAAEEKNVVVVAPSGECGTIDPSINRAWCPDPGLYGENPPQFPANLDGPNGEEWVIGVGSFDSNTNHRAIASFGDWVDISAPGEDFYTTYRQWDGGGREYFQIKEWYVVPSDLAAAHVAGVAALMRSANPDWTYQQIRDNLCDYAVRDPRFQWSTGERWARNDFYGCGQIQAERSIYNMPWVVDMDPVVTEHFVDTRAMRASLTFISHNLNAEVLDLVSDKTWIGSEPVSVRAGGVQQLRLTVDVGSLRSEHGGRLMSGTQFTPTVEVRARNDENPVMADRSRSQVIDYVLRIGEMRRIFMPMLRQNS